VPVYPLAYSFFELPPTAAFPKGHTAPRPVLRIGLASHNRRFDCYAIIDSGADHCVFPRSFMSLLGLNPLTTPVEPTSGMGSVDVPTHFAQISINLQGVIEFPVYAGFTSGLDQLGYGLLGQTGFFGRFNLRFELARRTCYIEIPSELP
jgi:hypothetical protein